MYHVDFDSWKEATSNASSFYLKVVARKTASDTYFTSSSAIPISALNKVMGDVEETLAAKQPLTLWDRTTDKITLIPYETIVTVTVELGRKSTTIATKP